MGSELYSILLQDELSGVNASDSAQLRYLLERIVPQTIESRLASRHISEFQAPTLLQLTRSNLAARTAAAGETGSSTG